MLIIDDERLIALALGLRLRAAGYDVRWEHDGVSGIAVAAEWLPDVIILDIRMPGIDGFEVNRRLRGNAKLRATPVIFLSANGQETTRRAALVAGAHAYLTKPYESRDVLAGIRSALDHGAGPVRVLGQGEPT